jgi:DNA-binding CsgD family transcriptional regulator
MAILANTFSPGRTEAELWSRWVSFARERLGASSSLYGFMPTLHTLERNAVTRTVVMIHNHPQDHIGNFEEDELLDDDVCTKRLVQDEPYFLWENALEWAGVTEAQRDRYQRVGAVGLNSGVSIRFSFFDGRGVGGLGLCCRGLPQAEFRRRWEERKEDILEGAHAFDEAMRPRMIANRYKLTQREKEVMALLCSGMLVKEAAKKLGIAPKTVFNITDRVRRNLGTVNTIEAVTKALAYNLI